MVTRSLKLRSAPASAISLERLISGDEPIKAGMPSISENLEAMEILVSMVSKAAPRFTLGVKTLPPLRIKSLERYKPTSASKLSDLLEE
jgi:hypothetical protein